MSTPTHLRLARCPWCNTHVLTLDITTCQVRCFECGAAGPHTDGTPQRAADLWNGDAELNESSLIEIGIRDGIGNRNVLREVNV